MEGSEMKKRDSPICNCHKWKLTGSFYCPVHGNQNWYRDKEGDKMTYREQLLEDARNKKLGDLAKQVLHRVYTSGIEDEVLIERCVEVDKKGEE